MLRSPPTALISIAVVPRVIPANADLRIVIRKASEIPEQDARNIVTTFEKPGLTPGGSPGRGGIRDSIKDNESAKAPIIPRKATFLAAEFFLFIKTPSVCHHICFIGAFDCDNNSLRQTGGCLSF